MVQIHIMITHSKKIQVEEVTLEFWSYRNFISRSSTYQQIPTNKHQYMLDNCNVKNKIIFIILTYSFYLLCPSNFYSEPTYTTYLFTQWLIVPIIILTVLAFKTSSLPYNLFVLTVYNLHSTWKIIGLSTNGILGVWGPKEWSKLSFLLNTFSNSSWCAIKFKFGKFGLSNYYFNFNILIFL